MATFYFTNDSYELQHHGILGMKWGVRRYQNSDGSLTSAGLKRYRDSESEYNKIKSLQKTKIDTTKYSKKDVKDYKRKVSLLKKASKQQLEEDYDHLAKDKYADKGMKKYDKGARITGNSERDRFISELPTIAYTVSYLIEDKNPKLSKAFSTSGTVLIGALMIDKYMRSKTKDQLISYYEYSSDYHSKGLKERKQKANSINSKIYDDLMKNKGGKN